MARRYLLDAVESSINERPLWSMSRDLTKAVNFKLNKSRWSKNIGAARIGALARILEQEGKIERRPTKSRTLARKHRYEYRPIFRIKAPDFSGAFSLLFSV